MLVGVSVYQHGNYHRCNDSDEKWLVEEKLNDRAQLETVPRCGRPAPSVDVVMTKTEAPEKQLEHWIGDYSTEKGQSCGTLNDKRFI
jgi:hypothetical protein